MLITKARTRAYGFPAFRWTDIIRRMGEPSYIIQLQHLFVSVSKTLLVRHHDHPSDFLGRLPSFLAKTPRLVLLFAHMTRTAGYQSNKHKASTSHAAETIHDLSEPDNHVCRTSRRLCFAPCSNLPTQRTKQRGWWGGRPYSTFCVDPPGMNLRTPLC